MNTRRMTLLVAIILALGTGYITISYLQSQRQAATPPASEMRSVLVAGVDIPARSKITRDMLRRSDRAASEVDPDAVLDEKQTDGTLALITIPAGGTITLSKIGRPADVGLTVRLPKGMRAVSIAVDRVKGVSGLVQPGDHVDVIAVPPRVNQNPTAYTIIRGAVVMAIGSQLEQPGATPAPGTPDNTTVTIAVTPHQADVIAMADLNTTLRLSLRTPTEPIRSEPAEQLVFAAPQGNGGGGGGSSDSGGARNVPPPPAAYPEPLVAAQQAPAVVPAYRPNAVTVIDGDRVTQSADAIGSR